MFHNYNIFPPSSPSTHRESNLLKRIFQCCLLNGGLFGFSIILFEYALLPFIKLFLRWMFTNNPGSGAVIGSYIVTFLSIVFGMIWVLPLFILSKIVNSLWFQVSTSYSSWSPTSLNIIFIAFSSFLFLFCLLMNKRTLPIQRINFEKVNRNCCSVSVSL